MLLKLLLLLNMLILNHLTSPLTAGCSVQKPKLLVYPETGIINANEKFLLYFNHFSHSISSFFKIENKFFLENQKSQEKI